MKSDRPTFQCLLLGFRPLSWGLSFNNRKEGAQERNLAGCFRPLSWGLSFNEDRRLKVKMNASVFVPFLGDFLSMNERKGVIPLRMKDVFVPFLGDFLSMCGRCCETPDGEEIVFVPFLGDFLSISERKEVIPLRMKDVFVPFLGDFLSIGRGASHVFSVFDGFRPLSWGLSFNSPMSSASLMTLGTLFSSPFLGTFFQYCSSRH